MKTKVTILFYAMKAKADAKEAEKLAKKAQELEKKRLDFVSQKNIQEEKVK